MISAKGHIHSEPVFAIASADKCNPVFPLLIANDGFSEVGEEKRASATCFYGNVQLSFPTVGPGFHATLVCHCTDCRTVTASMFATNFTVPFSHIKFVRGKSCLKQYAQATTIATENTMSNSFCYNCGTLMYRASSGFPNLIYMRVGTVDNFALHETRLKPTIEIFCKDRVAWLEPIAGSRQAFGNPLTRRGSELEATMAMRTVSAIFGTAA